MTQASKTATGEMRAVIILSLGFGLVGIDRFLISAMFPTIARDLNLGYGDIGTIAGALAIAWGIAALFMGNLADRLGRRKVLVGSLIVFSLLIGLSGLATGLAGLIVVRIVMGLADGAYTPASISATMAASSPGTRGRNIGIQQMMLPLFGLGFAPLIVTFLLHYIDWRWIFVIFLPPGLLIAWFTARHIPANAPVDPAAAAQAHGGSLADWRSVLAYRNIRALMALMLCWLTCLITTSAFMPSYLIDHLKMGNGAMGIVMSAIGFGATAGSLLLVWASDFVGRKLVIIGCTLGGAISLYLLGTSGPDTYALAAFMFMVQFFNFAALALTVGPTCAETVPPHLMATASGLVIAFGELFGGGLAPIIVGHFVEAFGMEHMLRLPLLAFVAAFFIALLLKETKQAAPLSI